MYSFDYARAALVGVLVGLTPWVVVGVVIAVIYHFAGLPTVFDVDALLLSSVSSGIAIVVGFVVTSNITLAGDVIAKVDDIRGQATEIAMVVAAFVARQDGTCTIEEGRIMGFVKATLMASIGEEKDANVAVKMRTALRDVVSLSKSGKIENRVSVYLCRSTAQLSTLHGQLRTLQDRRVPSCVEVSVLLLAVLNVMLSLETVKPESFGSALLLSLVMTVSSAGLVGLSGTVRDPLERRAFSFRIRPDVHATVETVGSFCGGQLAAGATGAGWLKLSGF